MEPPFRWYPPWTTEPTFTNSTFHF